MRELCDGSYRQVALVIVGAGLAGGNVAVGVREQGFDGEVVVLGDEPGLPFERPPLSKTYLRDEEELSEWLVKLEDWYGQHDVTLRTDARVERVDAAGRRVVVDGGNDITKRESSRRPWASTAVGTQNPNPSQSLRLASNSSETAPRWVLPN